MPNNATLAYMSQPRKRHRAHEITREPGQVTVYVLDSEGRVMQRRAGTPVVGGCRLLYAGRLVRAARDAQGNRWTYTPSREETP